MFANFNSMLTSYKKEHQEKLNEAQSEALQVCYIYFK